MSLWPGLVVGDPKHRTRNAVTKVDAAQAVKSGAIEMFNVKAMVL